MKKSAKKPTNRRLLNILRRMLAGDVFYMSQLSPRITQAEVGAVFELGGILHVESIRGEPTCVYIRDSFSKESEEIAEMLKELEQL